MERIIQKEFISLFMSLTILLAVNSLFTGCNHTKDPIQIGFIGTLSGKYSDLGRDVLEGIQLAIDETNEAGGLNGHPIELVIKDDQGKAEQAINAAKSLRDRKIQTVIGPNLSSVAVQLVPWCDTHQIFLLSPTVSTSILAGLDDSLIRIMPHNGYHQALEMTLFVRDTMKMKQGVILYDESNQAYAKTIVDYTEQVMREQGVTINSHPFQAGKDFDYGSMIQRVVQPDTEFIYLVSSALDTAMFCWQIKKQKINTRLFIRGWAITDEFFRVGNEAVEGAILLTSGLQIPDSETMISFTEKLTARTPRKSTEFMAYGYEAMQVLITAMKKDLSNPRETILSMGTFQGLRDTLHIDRFGDVQRPMFPMIIKDGKTELFQPAQ